MHNRPFEGRHLVFIYWQDLTYLAVSLTYLHIVIYILKFIFSCCGGNEQTTVQKRCGFATSHNSPHMLQISTGNHFVCILTVRLSSSSVKKYKNYK